MGLFDRFRKKDDSVLPSEVDEYYKSELKNRRSSSVLMAVLALIVTLVVAAGLYYGVRAIYRAVNSDEPAGTTSQTQNDGSQEGGGQTNPDPDPATGGSENGSPDDSENTESDTSTGTPSSGDGTPETGDIPSTGDAPEETLPSTGDEGR